MQLDNTWSAVAQWEESYVRVYQGTVFADLKPPALEGLCSRLTTLLDMQGAHGWPVWQYISVSASL